MRNIQTAGPLVGCGLLYDSDGSPLTLTHGQGPYVFTDTGDRLTDFFLGMGPVILGHNHDAFTGKMMSMIGRGLSLPSYAQLHYDYAEQLMDGGTGGHAVVLFTKTASEAVSFALRLAAMETGKLGILRCGYLGQSDVALGRSIRWHELPASNLRDVPKLQAGCRGISEAEPVFDWTGLDLDSLAVLIAEHRDQIGAMAIDAHQFAFIGPDKIDAVIEICQQAGIMLVLDETKTAGRAGPRGFFDAHADRIDYIVLGKAIGNGGPLAVLTGRPDRAELYRAAQISSTNSKEIFGAACGLAKLQVMEDTGGHDIIRTTCQAVVNVLNTVIEALDLTEFLEAVTYFDATLFELHFKGDILNDWSRRNAVNACLRAEGLLILHGHCSFICTDHATLDLDELASRFSTALQSFPFDA